MISDEIYEALQRANRELLKAENDLSRQPNDSAKLSACQSALKAMKQIMRLYLTANCISTQGNEDIATLLQMCINKNAAFGEVDLSNIDCEESDYAAAGHPSTFAIEHVSNYTIVASQLKSIVWSDLKI